MDLIKIKLPSEIEDVLKTIENNGYEAYVVGGAVRDSVMGRDVSDYDVTTNAKPSEISKMFSRVIETGLKHGTVTVLTKNYAVEVTTYRVDGEYKNHRKPKDVEFSKNIEDDLKRRDFTINALAYNKSNFIDLYGGMSDINLKVIRTVGNADERFSEDALRILRAVRFSAMLGFDIADDVRDSIYKNAHLLEHISAERKKAELDKVLMSNHLEKLSGYEEFLSQLIPNFERFTDFDAVLSKMPQDIETRWATVMHYTECKPSELMKAYKFSNAEKKKVTTLLKWYACKIPADKQFIKRMLRIVGEEYFLSIINMRNNSQGIRDIYDEIKEKKEPYLISHLAVDGNDISKFVDAKRDIGKVLNELLDMVIADPSLNKADELLRITEEFMEHKTIFARNLYKMRNYLGLSQQALADKAGMTKTAISNYEISYSEPKRKYLGRICEALGVSASDLYAENFDPKMVREGVFQKPTQERIYIFNTDTYASIATNEISHATEYIDMPKSPEMRSGECIVVKCPDNSMDNAGFSRGEYVIISKRMNFKDGEIYALFVDGEFYIRRISISGDIMTLIPDSNYKEFSPVQFSVLDTNVIPVGKVIHSIKNY